MKILAFYFLIFPAVAFSFSETELESLESEGTKTFSKSSWRRDVGFSFIRNLEVSAMHESYSERKEREESGSIKSNKFCDPDSKNSLCDLSSLYYKMDFTLYYSMAQWAEKYLSYSYIKNTELFLSGSFTSNFSGGDCSHLKDYDNLKGYVKCGAGDLVAGWTAPVYQKQDFFSYFNFSILAWPLSQKSKNTTLKTAVSAEISTLYFLKKSDKWSRAVSSRHSLAYNHFTKPFADKDWSRYNNPFNSAQALSLIVKQNFNKYLPANTTFSIAHNLALNAGNTYWIINEVEKGEKETEFWNPSKKKMDSWNVISQDYKEYLETVVKKNCSVKSKLGSVIACGNRYQHLSLRASASWKLDNRMYLNFSVWWRDLINLHSPIDKEVEEKTYASLDLNKWHFSLRASYSF